MNRRGVILILTLVLMITVLLAGVSAQEIDVDSMDNAELMTLRGDSGQ